MLNIDIFYIGIVIFILIAFFEIGWFCIKWVFFLIDEKEKEEQELIELEVTEWALQGQFLEYEYLEENQNKWYFYMNLTHF